MNSPLSRLAKLYGVQTSYIGLGGKKKEATPEALIEILRLLGANVRRMDDVPKALRDRENKLKREPAPVLVAWNGRLSREAVQTLGRRAPKGELPTGYHSLGETFIISAPRKAYFPRIARSWGVFAPIYSLRSDRRLGSGDLTDFESVVMWAASRGCTVHATLPMLAGYMNKPFEPSPYSPLSRIFWNELYADPEKTLEYAQSRAAQRRMANRPATTELVNYRDAMAYRRSIFEALADEFFKRGGEGRRNAFETFKRDNPQLEEYARFRAVVDRRESGWTDWPKRMRDGKLRLSDFDPSAAQYHMYVQWVVQDQLERLAEHTRNSGGLLYLDLPLGLHKDAYDIWKYPDFFVRGASGGAPPDIVFTTGQDWSIPPMHPEKMRENRHQYTIDYIRNHLKYAGLLRIDHVMGLHRFFWIPNGMPVSEGVYVEYPAEELYAVLSVESHRNKAGIVGENLGNVAPIVNASMRRHNIHQMYVAQYQLSGEKSGPVLNSVPRNAVASLNTHDMPPYRAFLDGLDIKDKLALGFTTSAGAKEERTKRAAQRKALASFFKKRATPEELLRASLRFLADSEAQIVLVNLEDLWLEVKPQNIPATTSSERPNWQRRLKYSIERIQRDKKIQSLLRDVDRGRRS